MGRFVVILVLSFFFNSQLGAQGSVLLEALKEIPGVEVIGTTAHGNRFGEAYEIRFTQPLDHNDPEGATFTQRMFIGHLGFDRPMVLSTSGYSAANLGYCEPAGLLKSNMIRVEHRFFGESVPNPLIWEHLTTWQAASDLHAIVEVFKVLYPGKWVSTGHSKDGQTAMMFKAFYPDDIDVAIPYVAPLNTGKTDPRIFAFLEQVGTEAERNRVKEFQRTFFERKSELMPLMQMWAKEVKWTFPMGIDRAYELAVLEFPFVMWQYGHPRPMDLPGPDATVGELMKVMKMTNALYYFSEAGLRGFLPHYYQAMTEMGYYGYDTEPFRKYLQDTMSITWDLALIPYGLDTTFNPKTLPFLHDFVHNQGDKILYIYGELDTWTATGVTEIKGPADAMVMVLKGGYHSASIRAFCTEERLKIYEKLTEWLEFPVPVQLRP
ncbi:MAG: S28 family serine protease [Bacteroidales bacterium]|nr:S28 family serine protease [Bacteroidales bacterium]